jgi:hypothetical protein
MSRSSYLECDDLNHRESCSLCFTSLQNFRPWSHYPRPHRHLVDKHRKQKIRRYLSNEISTRARFAEILDMTSAGHQIPLENEKLKIYKDSSPPWQELRPLRSTILSRVWSQSHNSLAKSSTSSPGAWYAPPRYLRAAWGKT